MVRKTGKKDSSSSNNSNSSSSSRGRGTRTPAAPSWTQAANSNTNRFLERYFNTPVYVRMVNQISILCMNSKIQSINIDPVYGIQLNSGAMGDIDLDAIREKAFNKHFKSNSINYKNLIRERVKGFILNTDCSTYKVTTYENKKTGKGHIRISRLDNKDDDNDDDTGTGTDETATERTEKGTDAINDADVD